MNGTTLPIAADEAKHVAIKGRIWNQLVALVSRLTSITAQWPISVTNTPQGIHVGFEYPLFQFARGKVTNTVASSSVGRYAGVEIVGVPDGAPADALTTLDTGETTTNAIEIWNVGEASGRSAPLSNGDIVWGWVIGNRSDTNATRVLMVDAGGPVARVGRVVCAGPEGEALPSDQYRWVQLQDIAATCDADGAWTLADTSDGFSPCDSAYSEGIVLARYVGGEPIQPNREVVVVPVPASGSADRLRWAIVHMDERDNGESCETADKCYYEFTYSWNCETDEVHDPVTFDEVRCGAPGPRADVVGKWTFLYKDSQNVVFFSYWMEGAACDPEDETPCVAFASSGLTEPDPPTAAEIAEACLSDQQICDNPVVNVYADADFIYVEYCDGTTKKYATCCNETPGDNRCWYQFEAQWDCDAEDHVPDSMRWIAGECAAFADARSTAWTFASRAGDIVTLTKWVRSTQVCDDDTDCDTRPPVTVFPASYPDATDVAGVDGCTSGVDCDGTCDCDMSGVWTLLESGVADGIVTLTSIGGGCYDAVVTGSSMTPDGTELIVRCDGDTVYHEYPATSTTFGPFTLSSPDCDYYDTIGGSAWCRGAGCP